MEVFEMIKKIELATGLSRTRLSELLYEHEGFVDHANGLNLPDRIVPEWINKHLIEPHFGDCNGKSCACMTCHAAMALSQFDELVAAIVRDVKQSSLPNQTTNAEGGA